MAVHRRDLVLSGLAMAGLGAVASAHAGAVVGKPAPDFQLTSLDGHSLSLAGLKGKVIVVNFWATWCGPCRAEMPALDAFYKAHKASGLEIIAVSQDDKAQDAKVKSVAKGISLPTVLARDAKVAGFGRLWQLPTTFVIDRTGVLRFDGSDKATVFTPALLDQVVGPLLKA